jgi:hypothetical protein
VNDNAETISSTTPSVVTLDSTAPAGANASLTLDAAEPCSSKRSISSSAKSRLSLRGSTDEYTISSGINAEYA